MPLTPNCCASAGFASTSTLASSTAPSRASTSRSSTGASAWHGPHHSAQKSTTTGQLVRALETSSSKVCVGDVHRRQRTMAGSLSVRGRRPRRSPRAARPSRCSSATPSSERWSRSISIVGPGLEPERTRRRSRRRSPTAARSRTRHAGRPAAARSPRARGAPRSGSMRTFESEPMQSGMPRWLDADRGQEPVAEVGLGRRAGADRRAAVAEQVELGAVGVGRVDDVSFARRGSRSRRAARSGGRRARRGTPRSRAAARRRGRGARALLAAA